jgi:ribosomal protein S18 acetylase RimI-like enzyme
VKIVEPSTPEEFKEYYKIRWEVLRKPWGQPEGSEQDELEEKSTHAMAVSENGEILGVIRLQNLSPDEGQIRYMGVVENGRGKGIGSQLIDHIEQIAVDKGIQTIVLQARENALDFYRSKNYELIEKSYLMWNQIQHFLMKKRLK